MSSPRMRCAWARGAPIARMGTAATNASLRTKELVNFPPPATCSVRCSASMSVPVEYRHGAESEQRHGARDAKKCAAIRKNVSAVRWRRVKRRSGLVESDLQRETHCDQAALRRRMEAKTPAAAAIRVAVEGSGTSAPAAVADGSTPLPYACCQARKSTPSEKPS